MSSPETNWPEATRSAEEKLADLEARFAVLERRYNDLHEKAFTVTDNSTGNVTEVAVTQVLPSTNGKTDKDAQATEADSTKSRAKIVINRTDPATGERKDQFPSDTSPVAFKIIDTSHAFTLRKFVYNDEEDNQAELDITNVDLWNLLKDVIGGYPGHIFRGPPVTIPSPYEPLIFSWDRLQQVSKAKPKDKRDKQARTDLELLLDTLSSGSGDLKLDKYFKMRESNKEQKSVTFETLWTLFPPGTLVYGKAFLEQDQVFVVRENISPWPHLNTLWTLSGWTYDWDGNKFKRVSLSIPIQGFHGHKLITTLPFYPLEFQIKHAEIKKDLIERGKTFRKICMAREGLRMFEYSGKAIFEKRGFSGVDDKDDDRMSPLAVLPDLDIPRRRRAPLPSVIIKVPPKSSDIDGRVMVDFQSYSHYGPASVRVGSLVSNRSDKECRCEDCNGNKALKANSRSKFDDEECQRGDWDDEQFMLCPPRVLGYILREKQWAQLQVTSLKHISKDDQNNSWSTRLKLADGDETKKLILDLVNSHAITESEEGETSLEVDDIVAQKGKGLVILLYGPPGVGKTSTAETVAIAARKPLFSISVADVGIQAKNVEANLSKIFALATAWQAILLIDEADVFLESRGRGIASNTERNALVSVFLRVLEYYQGILMLTTNQIAQFDIAVQSRIHIAIKYSSLSKDQTIAIFEGFLNPLNGKGLVKDIDGVKEWLMEDVCKMGFDGRQIRNIVTSALGLARAEKRTKLEKKDIKKVLSNVKDFKDEFIRQYESYKKDQYGMIV